MNLKLFLLTFLCVSVHTSVINNKKDAFLLTVRALTQYIKTGEKPEYLEFAAQNYQLPNIFRADADLVEFDNPELCYLCELVANALILERKLGMTDVEMAAEGYFFCLAFGIENERVCQGVVDLNVKAFMYIIDHNDDLTGAKACGLLLQNLECRGVSKFEWTIDIPEGQTIEKVKPTASTTFNILHLSDIHYDPYYTPGKTNKCGEPICCQFDQPDGTGEGDTCGYWAEYSDADVPLHTVHKAMDQVVTHDFDFVYYTGDIISHRVWATSVESNKKDITLISDMFHKYFTVPVYPAIGNHETHPVNVFSSEDETDPTLSNQWLYDLVAEKWGDWLTEDAKKTILRGGFYTVSPRDGFRVIVLNSNVCYIVNWWLLNEDKDPYGQLAWLVETLLEAEKNGEYVHILMHVPTGNSECLRVWSREYNKIIQRFSNTIVGHFNGHTHRDELLVYYDSSNSTKAINVAWNGASITTYSNGNPSYKLLQIDGETFNVLDFEEWTFNVTLANLDTNPDRKLDWYKLYSFKDAYGVNSLDPTDIDDLVQRMTKDHSLLGKYYNHKFRNSDYAVNNACGEACQKDLLCDIVTAVHGETKLCEKVVSLYDQNK